MQNTVNFDPFGSDFELSSHGSNDMFIQKLNILNFSSLTKETSAVAMTLYPNPFQHDLIVQLPQRVELIKVFDINGRLIHSQNTDIGNENTSLNLSHLQNGVYFVTVQFEGSILTSKVFKQ